eukprot:scaffold216367_cov11-Prasinocladus_malaysianus.AAC.1
MGARKHGPAPLHFLDLPGGTFADVASRLRPGDRGAFRRALGRFGATVLPGRGASPERYRLSDLPSLLRGTGTEGFWYCVSELGFYIDEALAALIVIGDCDRLQEICESHAPVRDALRSRRLPHPGPTLTLSDHWHWAHQVAAAHRSTECFAFLSEMDPDYGIEVMMAAAASGAMDIIDD